MTTEASYKHQIQMRCDRIPTESNKVRHLEVQHCSRGNHRTFPALGSLISGGHRRARFHFPSNSCSRWHHCNLPIKFCSRPLPLLFFNINIINIPIHPSQSSYRFASNYITTTRILSPSILPSHSSQCLRTCSAPVFSPSQLSAARLSQNIHEMIPAIDGSVYVL